jgi:hypothetical protein
MQVQVVQKPLKYGGHTYAIGELVKMTDKHARLFIAIGRACLPTAPRPDIPASPSVPVTIVETNEPAAFKETDAAQPEVKEEEPEQEAAVPDRPRRQYRRRDVRPENRDPQAED